jgi:hypothetical protein
MPANQQQTLEQLQHLKLHGMVKRDEAVIATGVHEQPEPFLGSLVDDGDIIILDYHLLLILQYIIRKEYFYNENFGGLLN